MKPTPPSLWALSAMALPLAFVSLPLYVLLPNRYAAQLGVSLASIGALLLAVRALDAVLDPWLGQQCDRWFARGTAHVWRVSIGLGLALTMGFAGLWMPDIWLALMGLTPTANAVLLTAAPCLVVAYLAATGLNLTLQTWGTRLGGSAVQRSRITAWREGLGLAGVVLASVLPTVLEAHWLVSVFAVLMAIALWLWARAANVEPHTHSGEVDAPAPHAHRELSINATSVHAATGSWLGPLRQTKFRALLQVFLLNGIASAIPATLVMFFIQDVLQAPAGSEALYLGAYFLAAAVSLPLWLRVVQGVGLARAWLLGQALSVGVFMWAVSLGAGDLWGFAAICVLSGAALGADLVVPGALLTGVIQRSGDSGQAEGAYLGWWQVATKLNLALAAGLALPLLQMFGYSAGTRSEAGLWALSVAYGVLPCVLKLLAIWRLWAARVELWEKPHGE
jgi:Na+/melibiose symporter-like transporter